MKAKHFGQQLKMYLEFKGIPATWLAKKLNISPSGVDGYYLAREPRYETREKILNGLGITEDDLYNFGNEVQEEEAVYNVVEKEDDYIKITPSQLTYLLEAVKERDDLKNARIKELEEKSRG